MITCLLEKIVEIKEQMTKNYFFRDIETDNPIPCYGCPKFIFDFGKQLILTNKLRLNYHPACAEKVQRSIEGGFIFVRPRPVIIRVKKVEKPTEISIGKSGDELIKINADAGDFMAIDIDGSKRLIKSDEFEKNYSIIEKVDE